MNDRSAEMIRVAIQNLDTLFYALRRHVFATEQTIRSERTLANLRKKQMSLKNSS